MAEHTSTRTPIHQILAVLCIGVFAGAMALHAAPYPEGETVPSRGALWNAFQYGVPLFMAGVCLTGKRWAFMTVVIYGTIGLALDIATLVQSLTSENASATFLIVILTTGILNFLLIIFGGKALLSSPGFTPQEKNPR